MNRVCICRRDFNEAERPPVCEPELFAAYDGGTREVPQVAEPPIMRVRAVATRQVTSIPALAPLDVLKRLTEREQKLQVAGR